MLANLKDAAQSWTLQPDGEYARTPHPGGRRAFSAHDYFMTNPSLSGRGRGKTLPRTLDAAPRR